MPGYDDPEPEDPSEPAPSPGHAQNEAKPNPPCRPVASPSSSTPSSSQGTASCPPKGGQPL
jgi:hypothetical protein